MVFLIKKNDIGNNKIFILKTQEFVVTIRRNQLRDKNK